VILLHHSVWLVYLEHEEKARRVSATKAWSPWSCMSRPCFHRVSYDVRVRTSHGLGSCDCFVGSLMSRGLYSNKSPIDIWLEG